MILPRAWHVVAEVLAAELGADPHVPAELVDGFLHLQIAKGVARLRAGAGQAVEVAGGGQLDGLEGQFRAGAADDDGEVVGRAGGGADAADLVLQEGDQAVGGQHRGGGLEQERLVGRAATLGDEEELVGFGVDFDLRRQVALGVLLLVHGKRRQLAVAQVALVVGVQHALAERRLVGALGPDPPPLLAHDDGGARVLAHGQDAAGGNVRVLQQVQGDETVVVRGLLVVENLPQLFKVPRAQQVVDVREGVLAQKPQGFGLDLENRLALEGRGRDAVPGELPVRCGVLAERKQRRGAGVGHGGPRLAKAVGGCGGRPLDITLPHGDLQPRPLAALAPDSFEPKRTGYRNCSRLISMVGAAGIEPATPAV